MVGGDLPLFYFGRHAGLLIHTSPAHKPLVNPRYTQISNLPPARWFSKCLEHIKAILNGFYVGVTGFEPATSASRTQRATGLRYTPNREILLAKLAVFFSKKLNQT